MKKEVSRVFSTRGKKMSDLSFAIVEVSVGSINDWLNGKCGKRTIVVDNDPVVKHRATTLLVETNNRTDRITAKGATITEDGPVAVKHGVDSRSIVAHLYKTGYHGAARKATFMEINGKYVEDFRTSNLKKRV